MAAQVEVQTGEVGRTGVGGRLHLSPLTDSSNKSLTEGPSSIHGSRIIPAEPSKPAPSPKPRLTPKPFAVEKNPTIRPILAPKPHPKPRPESTRPLSYKPDPPSTPKPPQPNEGVASKPRPVSTSSSRPAPTSFKPSPKLNTGQTTKPVAQPFKPAPPLPVGDSSKPTPPKPAERQKPIAVGGSFLRSSTKPPAAEWSGSTKKEAEKDMGSGRRLGVSAMSRAKSMDFLSQIGQADKVMKEEEKKVTSAVALRPQSKGSRPRPVSAIFLPSPTQTESSAPSPPWAVRRPLSADLTSRFESIGLSLHRKPPNTDSKENTPEEGAPLRRREREKAPEMTLFIPPGSDGGAAKPAVSDPGNERGKEGAEKVEEKSGGSSIKRRISLLLDSSSPVMGVTGQGPEPRSPVQPIPEAEVPVAGVKQRIRQLTVDTPPTQNPVVKPTPRPRPLPLDLTKRFTPERSTDLGSPSPIEATDHHDSASDPQSRIEASAASSSDQTKMTEDNIRAQEQLTATSSSPVAGTSDEGQSMGSVSKERESGSEVQTVRASLFENVVERHSVQVLDDDLPKAKGDALLSSPSIEQIDNKDDGTLVTATYREPVSPSSPMRVMHSFDTVPAVEGSRAVSESVPSAYLEDKAMTLRSSRRSEGNRPPAVDRTPPVQGDTGLAPTPGQQPPRYLRVGALPKWDASGPEQEVDMEKGRQRELEKERQLALERQREAERQRDAEREEAAAAPKRLKMLEVDEQPKPRATYFALTGQIQEPASPADAGNTPGPFDDVSVRSGQWGSQGKIVPFRRNSSLEEAFGKSLQIPYQVEEPMERSQVSETERGSVRDKHTAGEAMEVEKQRDPRSETDRQREKKELEREKQRQVDIERQKHLEFARMKERERQREFERQRQKEYEKEKQMELERRKNLEIEKERQRELERTQQLEKDRQWELERQKQIEIEKEKRQDLERERQLQLEKERQLQLEKERQRDLERQKLLEMETRRQQEVERERRREQENERLRQQEKERQLQMEKERQLQLEKERQRDLERQKLLEMETRRQQEVERERRREQENERLRQLEKERQLQLEKERQRDLERQKLLEMETRRQQELERERQREQESERQRQLEKERQQLEKERQWELERERQREAERERRELDRQREMEKETQRELERQQELEKDRLREMEKEKQREMEKERQREMEKERQREIERQRELEKERRRELEKERQREMEKERQRELEKEKNREVERQRKLDKERQLLEMQKERQRLEALERVKEMERRQLQEFERQKMEMEHRQQELEKQRLEEKMEKEEADKLRLVALQMEAEKMREAEQERVKELEKEQLRELERQRQRDLERQKKLDFERREMENQKMRELEKERRQKEELERLKEMERRQLLEFEKQKQQKAEKERMQLAELEKHRLRERMVREEAEKMRQVAKQQEAERQRIKEKQRREEQERADPSPLRPKVLDLDSVLKEDQRSKASSHHGDPATRWKLPSPRTDEPYKPVHLDIDSFTSQTQHSPSREVFPVAGIQDVDASGGVKVLPPTPERGNKAAPEAVAVRSRLSSQDPWELNPGEMSVDRPVAAPEPPKKPANKPSLEQLLLKHEERLQTPERRWSALADEPPHASRDPSRAGSPGRAPFSNSNPMELVRAPKESELKGRSGNARGQRRSQGSQELNRMRSRSVSRRSMPSESAMEGSLSRMRSRSAHRERDQQTWVQQKQSGSGEDEGKDTDTLVHETDSQYGTWETGLHTDDSLTPATPSSESNPSPSPRKPTPPQTPEDPAPSIHTDTPDGLSAPSEIEPLNFPEAPATLLDTSALRSRAQLGKKRAPRSRPSRAARQNTALTAPPEGQAGATEDWRYRDSTEDKVENKQEESDSEEQARGADSRSAASSQPQRVALFPGMMDPSALKAQLKKRGEPEGQLDVPAPSQLSRSPKSPFLPRAARVLPPSGGKENGEEESSPQWLRELKSKKRLSQYDNDS